MAKLYKINDCIRHNCVSFSLNSIYQIKNKDNKWTPVKSFCFVLGAVDSIFVVVLFVKFKKR